jgi:hypothetical protein
MPTLIDQELYPEERDMEYANRPRTLSVLILLMFAATIISYLVAYAAPSALVSADVLAPWPSYADPRPRWMFVSFCGLMGTFIVITGLFRILSRLQIRQIDAMVDDR